MKKFIENNYTAPYIELDKDGYIIDVIPESDALADYGGDTIDNVDDFWNCFENLTREDLIGEKEDLEKFEKNNFGIRKFQKL